MTAAAPVAFSHVLISRPAEEAVGLADHVRALGLEPVRMPAFRFAPMPGPLILDPSWLDAHSRLLIFTSPRAVRFGLQQISRELLDGALLAAIGPATRVALECTGLEVDVFPDGSHDSEGLLASDNLPIEPGAALIVTAPGGRTALRDGLAALGWQVREAFVYERLPWTPEPFAQAMLEQAAGVLSLWTSGYALQHLLQALSPAARRAVLDGILIVPSQRLQAQGRALGAAHVRLSHGAGNDALAKALDEALAESLGGEAP